MRAAVALTCLLSSQLLLGCGARLSTHALTEVVSSVTEARALLRTHERWLGWWVEGLRDHDALVALWRSRAPGAPPPPVLLIGDTRPELDATALPHRWLPKSAPRAEERYFLGYCLAYEVSGRGLVAAAVENLGREHELTARQMELTAISTLPQGRDDSHSKPPPEPRRLVSSPDVRPCERDPKALGRAPGGPVARGRR